MKIAIEALGIHYFGGGRSATLNLLETLIDLDHENEYLVFLTQPEPSLRSAAGNVKQWTVPIKNRFLLRLWAQIFLPRIVHGFHLTHFAKNLGVFGVPTPTIVTVYDLTTLIYPHLFPHTDIWYWKYIQKHTLRNATKIIAISNTTANDIIHYYQIPEEKIKVIYPICAGHFQLASTEEIFRVRQKYSLPKNYFLHVGRIDRKKNLTLLVQAFADYRKNFPIESKLVFVGEEYKKSIDTDLFPTIRQFGLYQSVIFTGQVPDDDLPALYSGSLATVFPSLHEGFGLTPVEAMACGAPLITHSAGAVGEVVQDGAIVLHSVDRNSMAEALLMVAKDPHLRKYLQSRGLSIAKQYQGKTAAEKTLQLYKEIIRQ